MGYMTPKRIARLAEARPVREQLKIDVGRCEFCLRSRMPEALACHEIFRGVGRQACLDKRFGILVVCREPNWRTEKDCHATVQSWKEVKQLALLYLVRNSDFDLTLYNQMVNPLAPARITLKEVLTAVDVLLQTDSKTKNEGSDCLKQYVAQYPEEDD